MQPQSTVSAKCPGKARNEEQNVHPTAPGCPMDLLLSEQMAILQLVARLKKKNRKKPHQSEWEIDSFLYRELSDRVVISRRKQKTVFS